MRTFRCIYVDYFNYFNRRNSNVIKDGHVFFKLCKMAKFSSEQIKEMAIHENTLMKFFTSNMERLENKIEMLSNENTLLKQEVESLKTGADFQNKWLEEREI